MSNVRRHITSLLDMRLEERQVIRLPLSELWNEGGELKAERRGLLGPEHLRQLLQRGAVQFVVAEAGRALRWVPMIETFVFWKAEVLPHLVNEPDGPLNLYQYPEGYCYIASEWQVVGNSCPVVVLECHH